MKIEYTDTIIDTESNSAGMIVRVRIGGDCMENALHIKWNEEGKIIALHNWYGNIKGER